MDENEVKVEGEMDEATASEMPAEEVASEEAAADAVEEETPAAE